MTSLILNNWAQVVIYFCFINFSKPQEGLQQMFEKSLEDFYCICDQLEINLVRAVLALVMSLHAKTWLSVSNEDFCRSNRTVQQCQLDKYMQCHLFLSLICVYLLTYYNRRFGFRCKSCNSI